MIWAELNIPSTGISSDTGLNLGINTWITLQHKLGESGIGREDQAQMLINSGIVSKTENMGLGHALSWHIAVPILHVYYKP